MKSIKFLVAALVLVAAVPMFGAVSAPANLDVTANVTAVCTITTTPVAFGPFDPTAGDLTANGGVTVTCTRGSGVRVDLDNGANFGAVLAVPAPSTAPAYPAHRAMLNSTTAGAYLAYQLYKDGAYATVWGTGDGNGLDVGPAPAKTARNFVVYGRIPG